MKQFDLPPLWLACFAVVAWWQAQVLSLGLTLAHPVTSLIAGLLIGAGMVLTLLAAMEFRRARTTIIPHREPAQLITSGIFSKTRNPIYLADVLILAGLCLWFDAVLSLVLVPVLAVILERRFIVPEENRLRRLFRADFARYAEKTGRWV
ncbi:methyltransferase family protein [Roseobacter ponti]|uniref:Isoprenylcysteine carboxylmethyltransferase family protein n=1 Tax=Roseobacter ponti TaxID=1891787 RepID=A0A858SS56_9RHOB|nr:isoprenylcysteine carboxylmethyltransferase family protein [Roseobacter ponti]QJF50817.1 isoprenylcysteine carboxylmethyltransferase family protein [Roseobacter ponti]